MIGRLKNEARKIYKTFSRGRLYQILKRLPLLRKIKLKIGKFIWKIKPYNYSLHGDHVAINTLKIVKN